MAIIAANAVTRMGLGGAMWQPHGSYAGKEEGDIAPPPTPNEAQREPVSGGTASSWPSRQDYKDKKQHRILEDDEDFMRICKEALPKILEFLRRN